MLTHENLQSARQAGATHLVDMIRVLGELRQNGYRGVLIPDHMPEMTCGAPWHAGMAYARGYLQAALQSLERV